MAKVFLSYARSDIEPAKRVAAALEALDISVWWDPDIEVGENWKERLVIEAQAAKIMLLLLSQHSIQSEYVQAEFREADKRGKKILPIAIEAGGAPGFPGLTVLQIQKAYEGLGEEKIEQRIARIVAQQLKNPALRRVVIGSGIVLPLGIALAWSMIDPTPNQSEKIVRDLILTEASRLHEVHEGISKDPSLRPQVHERALRLARDLDKVPDEHLQLIPIAMLKYEYLGDAYVIAAEAATDPAIRAKYAELAFKRSHDALRILKYMREQLSSSPVKLQALEKELRDDCDEERALFNQAWAIAIRWDKTTRFCLIRDVAAQLASKPCRKTKVREPTLERALEEAKTICPQAS